MKLFLLLLLFLSVIKYTETKKSIRKYLFIRDEQMDNKGLSQYSILDGGGKQYLYRLKTSYINNSNEILLISYPSKDIVGYLDGQWTNDTLNVTFEIFDLNMNQSINGTIKKVFDLFVENYYIQLNDQTISMKKKIFSENYRFYNENKSLLAQFRKRFRWFNWSLVKYDLHIFIDQFFSDLLYFFPLIIVDHRSIVL